MPKQAAPAGIQLLLRQLLNKNEYTAYQTSQSLADALGISTRTLRRWKNEGRVNLQSPAIAIIQKEAREQRRKMVLAEKRQHVPKIPATVKVDEQIKPVIRIQGYRKKAMNMKTGKRTGPLLTTVTYNVSNFSISEQDDIIRALYHSGKYLYCFLVMDVKRSYELNFDPKKKVSRIPDPLDFYNEPNIEELLNTLHSKLKYGYVFTEFNLTLLNVKDSKRVKKSSVPNKERSGKVASSSNKKATRKK